MTGFESVFFDTAPFIYLIENHPVYYSPVAKYLTVLDVNENLLLTSSLTAAEFGCKPAKNKETLPLENFKNLIKEFNFKILDVNMGIVEFSWKLIEQYPFLKMIDSLQLSMAMKLSSTKFLTNDFELKKVKEIEVILVNDIIK